MKKWGRGVVNKNGTTRNGGGQFIGSTIATHVEGELEKKEEGLGPSRGIKALSQSR